MAGTRLVTTRWSAIAKCPRCHVASFSSRNIRALGTRVRSLWPVGECNPGHFPFLQTVKSKLSFSRPSVLDHRIPPPWKLESGFFFPRSDIAQNGKPYGVDLMKSRTCVSCGNIRRIMFIFVLYINRVEALNRFRKKKSLNLDTPSVRVSKFKARI